jgi:hypothetical protein
VAKRYQGTNSPRNIIKDLCSFFELYSDRSCERDFNIIEEKNDLVGLEGVTVATVVIW